MTVSSFIEEYHKALSNRQIIFYLWLVDRYGLNCEIDSNKIKMESYKGERSTQRSLSHLHECGLLKRKRIGMQYHYKIIERKAPMRLVG